MARPSRVEPPAPHLEAARRRADVSELDSRTKSLYDALAAERRGYVTRGLDDRVAQVDAQIARLLEAQA